MKKVNNSIVTLKEMPKTLRRIEKRCAQLGLAPLIISQEEVSNWRTIEEELNSPHLNSSINPFFLAVIVRLEKSPEMLDDYLMSHVYNFISDELAEHTIRYAPWIVLYRLERDDEEVQRKLCHLRPELSNPETWQKFISQLNATAETHFPREKRAQMFFEPGYTNL